VVEYVKNDAWQRLRALGQKYRYPALILAVGVLLLAWPKSQDAEPETAEVTEAFDLQAFQAQAEEILSDIAGAGKVQVLLTLDTDGARTYLSDQTQTQNADSSQSQTQAVVVTQSGTHTPVTVTSTYPTFRGAVVVCPGGGSAQVVLAVKEALSSLTGLGMDKITVLKSD
jgi:stage III sporulation protein AG